MSKNLAFLKLNNKSFIRLDKGNPLNKEFGGSCIVTCVNNIQDKFSCDKDDRLLPSIYKSNFHKSFFKAKCETREIGITNNLKIFVENYLDLSNRVYILKYKYKTIEIYKDANTVLFLIDLIVKFYEQIQKEG